MAITFFKTVNSFVTFLWNWKTGGGELVDQNTANIRAEICASCHNNKPSGDVRKGCGVCNKMGGIVLNSIRNKIINGQKTTSDSQILACGICGCDLKISVYIPNEALVTQEDANAYPSYCWKRKILESRDL